jgi:uncharacterized small protein (DUF1192 family)
VFAIRRSSTGESGVARSRATQKLVFIFFLLPATVVVPTKDGSNRAIDVSNCVACWLTDARNTLFSLSLYVLRRTLISRLFQEPRIIARAQAIYDYFGEEDVEDAQFLQFTQGSIIDVFERDESGWWEGSLDGQGTLAMSVNMCVLLAKKRGLLQLESFPVTLCKFSKSLTKMVTLFKLTCQPLRRGWRSQ